jgi:V/A-type H+-transporting ATPase subunit E
MGEDNLRDAILSNVKGEADQIKADAEAKGRELIEKAKRQRELILDEKKKELIFRAHLEALKILAQASMTARQEILRGKKDVVQEILQRAKHALRHHPSDKESLTLLIEETIGAFEMKTKVKLFVTSRDLGIVQEILREDGPLRERVLEVREMNGLGGVSAEDEEGLVRVDNTFDTRLETLMPKLLPKISKELFGVGEDCV